MTLTLRQGDGMTAPVNGNVAMAAMRTMTKEIQGGRYPWWYPDLAKGLAIDSFVYGSDWAPLPLSATVQNNINISGEAAFVCLSGVLIETDTLNTTFLTLSPLLFQIADAGSNRQLSNIPIHANNWFGTGTEPKYWDLPKIFAPNSTLAITAQNLEAVARNVRIALHGFKIFKFSP